jgi:hypothetical protein
VSYIQLPLSTVPKPKEPKTKEYRWKTYRFIALVAAPFLALSGGLIAWWAIVQSSATSTQVVNSIVILGLLCICLSVMIGAAIADSVLGRRLWREAVAEKYGRYVSAAEDRIWFILGAVLEPRDEGDSWLLDIIYDKELRTVVVPADRIHFGATTVMGDIPETGLCRLKFGAVGSTVPDSIAKSGTLDFSGEVFITASAAELPPRQHPTRYWSGLALRLPLSK